MAEKTNELDSKVKRLFIFKIHQRRIPDGTYPKVRKICVSMTQDEFEDYQVRRELIHEGIRAIELNPSEVVWYESPPIDKDTEQALRELIGLADDAFLIACYPHSYQHRHYKEIALKGVKYLYTNFVNATKYAKSMAGT
jgi:hypothetical protein